MYKLFFYKDKHICREYFFFTGTLYSGKLTLE